MNSSANFTQDVSEHATSKGNREFVFLIAVYFTLLISYKILIVFVYKNKINIFLLLLK